MRGVPAGLAGVLATALAVAGCGSAVVDEAAEPASSAYDGPMVLEVGDDDDPDPTVRGGAAARALECTGEIANGGGADYDSGLATVAGSAESALETWLRDDWIDLPAEGYRVEREDGDRVLLSWDVDERTVVAVIAHDAITDWEGATGWGVESWATCDVSELPAEQDGPTQVWTDAEGARVPTSRVVSYPGPEHCDWQDITFLSLGEGRSARQFLGGDAGDLADLLATTHAVGVELPRDATDTGFRRDGRELWVASDAAYLREPGSPTGERWPEARREIACA
jgi:hypothetical protein